MHVTSFLSAIDSLLTAGRSNAPTRVLTPMKAVINAVAAIVEDIKAFERRPLRERSDVDLDVLRSLRDRAEATLSNLVVASKTHATSSGLSPISLLDAAASHVSASITEMAKTALIRKATKTEQEQYAHTSQPSMSDSPSFSPTMRTVDEVKTSHQRKGSAAAASRNRNGTNMSPLGRPYGGSARRPPSANSSSEHTNSPPPIFDRQGPSGGILSDDSAHEPVDGPVDPWSELKVTSPIFCRLKPSLTVFDSHTSKLRQKPLSLLFKACFLPFASQYRQPI
jgi:protein SPA2